MNDRGLDVKRVAGRPSFSDKLIPHWLHRMLRSVMPTPSVVDVIVTRTTFVAAAAKRATATIPIVIASTQDPVGGGVIASLARPGGNVTGVTQYTTESA